MKRYLPLLTLFLVFFPGALAHAANLPLLDPNFSIVPEACRADCPCGVGAALQFIQNIMNVLISFAVVVMSLIIAWAGFLFVLSATNPESRSKARGMLINAFIGLFIVLSAWLIVDFIMKHLYGDGSKAFGPWNKILVLDGSQCIDVNKNLGQIPGLPGLVDIGVNGVAIGTGGGAESGSNNGGISVGKCAIQTSGPCSVSNLTSYFGDKDVATTFSKICTHESSGCVVKISTTDKTAEGKPVSFGCFQINITTHSIGGYNCSAAFTNPLRVASQRQDVHIKDARLYELCKAAALNDSINLRYAATLRDQYGLQPWIADRVCYQ